MKRNEIQRQSLSSIQEKNLDCPYIQESDLDRPSIEKENGVSRKSFLLGITLVFISNIAYLGRVSFLIPIFFTWFYLLLFKKKSFTLLHGFVYCFKVWPEWQHSRKQRSWNYNSLNFQGRLNIKAQLIWNTIFLTATIQHLRHYCSMFFKLSPNRVWNPELNLWLSC